MKENVAFSVELIIFPNRLDGKIFQVQVRVGILPSTSEEFVTKYPQGIKENYDHGDMQGAIGRYNAILRFWDVPADHRTGIKYRMSTELATAGVLHGTIPDDISMEAQTKLPLFFPENDRRPYKPG